MRVLDNIKHSFEIKDRGIMFSSSAWTLDVDSGEWEPWHIRGETVLLNGVEVKVIGVEAFCTHRSPTQPYRGSFAVLVSKEDAERVNWKS